MDLTVTTETWALKAPFSIAYHTWHEREFLIVSVSQDGKTGRGEGSGHPKYTESAAEGAARLEEMRSWIEAGVSRQDVLSELPPGPTRNALDSALWDLEAKTTGKSVWDIAGLEKPNIINTVMTVGIDTPEKMAEAAAAACHFAVLKIKLDGKQITERMEAVMQAAPDCKFVIDANEAWSIDDIKSFVEKPFASSIGLIEQPLERGHDEALSGFKSPIPICADESFQDIRDMDAMADRYDMINIKLDKIGGLTAALEAATLARKRGLGLMVGCMGGTSLGMAPAFVFGGMCDFIDLDAPLMNKEDRPHAMTYESGVVTPPVPALWG